MFLHVWSSCMYTGLILKQYSRCLRNPGRVFILCYSLICSRSEPFRPEEQLLSAECEIFLVTNMVTPLGTSTYINWSDLPQFFNSCLNPGSFSNSLQSDLLSDLVDFGLKLPDLSRYELFSTLYALSHFQSINFYLDMVFFWLDLSFASVVEQFSSCFVRDCLKF